MGLISAGQGTLVLGSEIGPTAAKRGGCSSFRTRPVTLDAPTQAILGPGSSSATARAPILAAANRAHVDAWARKLASDGRTPATVSQDLRRLGVLPLHGERGRDQPQSIAAVRRPKSEVTRSRQGLDHVEVASLIATARNDGLRTHALVLLLALNGLRISDAGAGWRDLDTERGHRVLRITRKGGKRSTVPLAPPDL